MDFDFGPEEKETMDPRQQCSFKLMSKLSGKWRQVQRADDNLCAKENQNNSVSVIARK